MAATRGKVVALPPSKIELPPTFTTWQPGSIRAVGTSVEDRRLLSSRLSRISGEVMWWRPSVLMPR